MKYVSSERPIPDRRVVLVWRKSFPRTAAIESLVKAIFECGLEGVKMLSHLPVQV